MKDYYKILELDVSATRQEIKKAYRRLAQQYHPDKNQTDPYATARFNEIKEAYEILSDPRKKEYYLEQRWLQHFMGKKKPDRMITPVNVLKNALEFDRHVSRLDIHRMNKIGLWNFISNELIPPETIDKLNTFNEKDVSRTITGTVLKNLHVIPGNKLEELKILLSKFNLEKSDGEMIFKSISDYQQNVTREKYKPFILLVIVILISIIIFFVGK